ncbi:hypothetical protein HDU97_007612 [Phlyctochytrium planicorne]|nr:hypothetical protein HDU97_007612 [Phlyctochytrium planicorne]
MQKSIVSLFTFIFLVIQCTVPIQSAKPHPPPSAYDRSPILDHLLSYSLLNSVSLCSPSQYLASESVWKNCSTCNALKWVQPTIVRFNNGKELGPAEEEILFDVGLLAMVSWNRTTETAVVVFRGSKAMDNILTDLMAWEQTLHNGIPIHSGFLSSYKDIEPLVTRELSKVLNDPNACPNCKTVVFTGFSLGGGLATLAAYMYTTNSTLLGDRKVRLITFGSPRVSTRALWDAVEKSGKVIESTRVVNADDLVPRVPFSFFGTRTEDLLTHVPGLIWWKRDEKSVRVCDAKSDVDLTGIGINKCDRNLNSFTSDASANFTSLRSQLNSSDDEREYLERRQSLVSLFWNGIPDHRSFGPFPLGKQVCKDDYSDVLNAIEFHQ